jgi:hypothetical protein
MNHRAGGLSQGDFRQFIGEASANKNSHKQAHDSSSRSRQAASSSSFTAATSETLQKMVRQMETPKLGLDFQILKEEREKIEGMRLGNMSEDTASLLALPSSLTKKSATATRTTNLQRSGLAMSIEHYIKSTQKQQTLEDRYVFPKNPELMDTLQRLAYIFDLSDKTALTNLPIGKMKSLESSRQSTIVKNSQFIAGIFTKFIMLFICSLTGIMTVKGVVYSKKL